MVAAALMAVPAQAATSWGTYAQLGPAAGLYAGAVLTSADELVVLTDDGSKATISVQPPGGGPAATQELGSSSSRMSDRLVADRQGNAYVVQKTDAGDVQLLRRPAGGSFTLDRSFAGPAKEVTVAASSRGDVLVVWSAADATFAAVRAAGGTWREPVTMPAMIGYPVARLSDAGWALIAWPGTPEITTSEPLTLVTVSPAGEASAPQDLHAAHDGGPVTMAVDDAGRFAVGWVEEKSGGGYSYEGALNVAYGQGGTIARRHSLGSGGGLSITANRHGDALLTWRLESEMYYVHGVHMNRMATLDLRDGSLGADEPAPVDPSAATVTDAGDRMLAGGTHSHASSRARRGGRLRAVLSFGCDLNPSMVRWAGIDSKGQGIVVSEPMPSPWTTAPITPHVNRDRPTEFWDTFSCGGITRPAPIPTRVQAIAGRAVEIPLTAAADPEASRELFEWDFDGDGSFETDTGTRPVGRHVWANPAQLTIRARQTRWFGDTVETRSWPMDVVVAPPPPPPSVSSMAQLTILEKSLRRARRRGVTLSLTTPETGPTRFELRRRTTGGRTRLVVRRTLAVAAGKPTTVRLRLPRSVRKLKLKSLRLEASALQNGAVIASARRTLR